MPVRAFVFDAYGTLFDVHAAVARYRDAAAADADRFSETWRSKQLEYAWMLSRGRALSRLLDADRTRSRLCVFALSFGRSRAPPCSARLLLQARRVSRRARRVRRAQQRDSRPRSCRTARRKCLPPRSTMRSSAAPRRGALGRHIRIYKPRAEVYALVTEAFAIAPNDVAFVSSNRWDVMGATAFGFRCVWVNRAGAPDEYPEFPLGKVVRELAGLAALDI